ncbi:hypothetical protein BJY14_008797 [Actinomadura luteofluorescens]|uniref:Uncharacterized protein n=1 Tax=Actinomadura luteofluorescens TaxID=46163 RepID=A0A7Y9ERW5_9ACTN|nr:hypothetical protein [Actinomadura luteofluorescens]NYD52814.1 hypothetical protein [Actinomadura luteofluorescens]
MIVSELEPIGLLDFLELGLGEARCDLDAASPGKAPRGFASEPASLLVDHHGELTLRRQGTELEKSLESLQELHHVAPKTIRRSLDSARACELPEHLR